MKAVSILVGAFVFCTIAVLTNPYICKAHPHAFVGTNVKVVFDADGMSGIHVSWVFDEMYSSMTGPEFDLDGDGAFNDKESQELIKLGNENLPAFDYFTHIEVDGKPYPVTSVQDFVIRYENGILYYEFFIDCKVVAGKGKHRLKISPYDENFYMGFFFPDKGAVSLEKHEPFHVETKIGEDPDELIFFDMMHPFALTLEFELRP